MGANKKNTADSGDTWKRNPMPGDVGDVRGPSFLMITLIICTIGLLLAIDFI